MRLQYYDDAGYNSSLLGPRLLRAGQLVTDDGALGIGQGNSTFFKDQGGYEFVLAVIVEITDGKVLDVADKFAGLPAWPQPDPIPGETGDMRLGEIPELLEFVEG